MASRRMFSKRIISSARFLKMPPTSQNLYFHLSLNADDDGIVEAYKIMKYISSSEDDLKVLVAKNYIKILNDDLVTYITDWTEHNVIRADRKIDSIYKDVLLQIIPDAKLIESKQRKDIKSGQSNDGQRAAQDRLGKDRLGEDSLGKDRLYKIFHHWNSKNIMVHKKTDKIYNKIRTTLKTYSEQDIIQAIDTYAEILQSDEYFFSYAWTLVDFLQRGLEKFLDRTIALKNYKQDKKETEIDKIAKKYNWNEDA